MKFLDRIFGSTKEQPAPTKDEQRTITPQNSPALLRSWTDTPTAGVAVTTRSALSVPSIFAAVSSVADTISTLPLPVYQETSSGPEKLREHPVHQLLNVRPNPIQTAKAYRMSQVVDLMSEGEHFSELQRDGAGNVVALWRIDPSYIQTKWVQDGASYALEYSAGGQVIPSENILHIVGFTADGFRGESPFRLCQNAISLTLALDQFGGSFMASGCRPGGILSTPPGLSDEDREAARRTWIESNSGSGKAGRTITLPDGFRYDAISLSPEEGQYHESRTQQMREMQRVTRTPPHISNDFERQTYANLQYSRSDYVQNTIRPICVAIEQAVNKTLLNNSPNVWAEHTLEGLLRGSFSEQVTSLSEAIASGIYTVDEARSLFNLPPRGEITQPVTQEASNGAA